MSGSFDIVGRGHGGGGRGHRGHRRGHRGHRWYNHGWGWGGGTDWPYYGWNWGWTLGPRFGVPAPYYYAPPSAPRQVHYLMGAEHEHGSRPVVHRPGYRLPAPAAHLRHHDYAYIEGYGWRPRWFPYWDPAWVQYWDYLYSYFGGESNPEYAEYARDEYLRSLAAQQGWM